MAFQKVNEKHGFAMQLHSIFYWNFVFVKGDHEHVIYRTNMFAVANKMQFNFSCAATR